MIATDLDGTLLRPDLTVSEGTRRRLQLVRDAGCRLAFVTGRPPRWMAPVSDTTGHTGTAVCANGAVTVDLATETIVGRHTFPPGVLARVADVVSQAMGADVRFAVEVAPLGPVSGSELTHEPGFLPAELARTVALRDDLWTGDDVVKVLARGSGDVADTDTVAARVAPQLGPVVTVSHSSRTHQLLEIAPAGVTKATGLAELVAGWGCHATGVVAFGDMPNDIPMLTWASWGVAVASAHPRVLAVADEIVADPEHEGLADWLSAHVLIGAQ